MERLPAKGFPFDGQSPTLFVTQEETALSQFLAQHLVFCLKVLDDAPLFLVDLGSQTKNKQVPRPENKFQLVKDYSFASEKDIIST